MRGVASLRRRLVDFWNYGVTQTACTAYSNASYSHLLDLWDTDAPADLESLGAAGGDYYEEYLFKDRVR